MSSTPATTPPPATGGFTEATFEAFLKGRDEPSWLRDRRREAFAMFQGAPWPSFRDEEWRRTDIRPLKLDAFAPPAPHAPSAGARAALAPAFETLGGLYGTGIEQIDAVATRAADAARLPPGVVFVDLARAVADHPEILRRSLLTDVVAPGTDALSALHAAFWTGGRCCYVPRGVKVEAPLFSLVGLSAEGGRTSATRWSSWTRGPRRASCRRRPGPAAAARPACTSAPSS
jgi:Fe-S cluster assembly protein SufD